ncbi:hypothetical protein LINPERHAP1_LOCUS26343, partial [Linum perenne]
RIHTFEPSEKHRVASFYYFASRFSIISFLFQIIRTHMDERDVVNVRHRFASVDAGQAGVDSDAVCGTAEGNSFELRLLRPLEKKEVTTVVFIAGLVVRYGGE